MIETEYTHGKHAVNDMMYYIERVHHKDDDGLSKSELCLINDRYSLARLAAIRFGEDVSGLPRKLKMITRLPTLQLPI